MPHRRLVTIRGPCRSVHRVRRSARANDLNARVNGSQAGNRTTFRGERTAAEAERRTCACIRADVLQTLAIQRATSRSPRTRYPRARFDAESRAISGSYVRAHVRLRVD